MTSASIRRGALVALFLAACLLVAMAISSCGSLWPTVRKHAGVGGSAAGGALLGSSLGPVGTMVGAGVGAIVWGLTVETSELRDGDVVGEEALRKEIVRWKGEAAANEAEALAARARANEAGGRADWFSTWLWRAIWSAVGYFVVRNRAHLLAFGPGYLRRLAHALIGWPLPEAPTAAPTAAPATP